MFDKLIESNSAEADFKPRRSYFMVSTVVVGILFLTAVVASLYAQDFDLGTDQFEISTLLAPVEAEAPEPPRPIEPEPQAPRSAGPSELPSRKVNMLNLNENPKVPDGVSVTPNQHKARPDGKFQLSDGAETDGFGAKGTAERSGPGVPGGSGASDSTQIAAKSEPVPEPPPVREKPASQPPVTRSLGVINGKATHLPKPVYPRPAQAVGAKGNVDVQVMIDEEGRVVSARAVSGPALLKRAAEDAARKARFSPTTLSNVPVKVTGVIVYKFERP